VTLAYYGGIYAIDTSNKALPLSCSSAWHKHLLDLEHKKTDGMKDTVTQKGRLWMIPIIDIIAELYRFSLFHMDYK